MAEAAQEEVDRVFARAEQAENDGDNELAEMLEDYYNILRLKAGDARDEANDKKNEKWLTVKSQVEDVL